MSTKQKIIRLERLGVVNFESLSETRHRQQDLNRRLQHTDVAPSEYEGLQECTTTSCGHAHCCDACWFGWRKRRLDLIPMVSGLFAAATSPVHEVRFTRGSWARPHGQLRSVSIGAAIKLNRWMLDKLYNPDVIAVGMVKVAPALPECEDLWVCEVHELVAGVQKKDVERVLAGGRTSNTFQNHWQVTPVHNLGQAVSDVFRQELRQWDIPGIGTSDSWPSKALRRELYSWQLGLDIEARVIRYGCNRHFNKLPKMPRKVAVRPRKPHPKPHWLKRHQFGYDPDDDPEAVLR